MQSTQNAVISSTVQRSQWEGEWKERWLHGGGDSSCWRHDHLTDDGDVQASRLTLAEFNNYAFWLSFLPLVLAQDSFLVKLRILAHTCPSS